jgi:hypothetical protein
MNIISDAEDHCTSCSDAGSDNEASIGLYEKAMLTSNLLGPATHLLSDESINSLLVKN